MEESIIGDFLFLIGAIFIAISLFMNEMKRFRYLYLVGSIVYVIYGIFADNLPVVFTSVIFFAINVYFLAKYAFPFTKSQLPSRFNEVYEVYKPYISNAEFNRIIDQSKAKTYLKEPLIEKGQDVSQLMLIINGTVEIINEGKVINTIGPGNFIGEFGILTGNKASATVHSESIVEVVSWSKYVFDSEKSLRQLVSINLVNKLIHINTQQAIEEFPTKSL